MNRYDCCRKSVSSYVSMYQAGGIAALMCVGYGTNKSCLDSHKESILANFEAKPPVNSAEAGARIKILTGIERSPTQVRAFMKRHGLKFVKLGHIPSKADTEKQQDGSKKPLNPP